MNKKIKVGVLIGLLSWGISVLIIKFMPGESLGLLPGALFGLVCGLVAVLLTKEKEKC